MIHETFTPAIHPCAYLFVCSVILVQKQYNALPNFTRFYPRFTHPVPSSVLCCAQKDRNLTEQSAIHAVSKQRE